MTIELIRNKMVECLISYLNGRALQFVGLIVSEILSVNVEDEEGHKYALRIVQLDAELPKLPEVTTSTPAQQSNINYWRRKGQIDLIEAGYIYPIVE